MKSNKDYILACAKAQGKISKLLWYCGEGDKERKSLLVLMEELEALKATFLREEPEIAFKIKNLKNEKPFYTGSCYTDPFGGWGGLNTLLGGWPAIVGGGVVVYDGNSQSDVKTLPFGRAHKKDVPVRTQVTKV